LLLYLFGLCVWKRFANLFFHEFAATKIQEIMATRPHFSDEANHLQSILQVADNFVDQVLQAACKNAKERGSKILEIRDIQLTLERGYNIRIPGYSSDEIRTVRKIQPAPGWIAKMSAVQAAKVTGGRSTD